MKANYIVKFTILISILLFTFSKVIEIPGFSSFQNIIRNENKCYRANSKVSNIKSFIEINQSMDFNLLEKAVKSLIRSEAFLFFEQYKSSKYLQSISHHTYQINYLLRNEFEVDFTPAAVGEGLLTEFGKNIYKNNNKYFQTYCGEFFIQKAKVNNALAINVSFHTNSFDDYLKLTQGSNINFLGLREVLSQVSSAASNNNIKGTIKFEVYQIGGSSEKLNAFLNTVDSTKSLFYQQCEFGNINACFAFVEKLIDYGVKDFTNQIEDSFQAINLENAMIISKLNSQMFGLISQKVTPLLNIMKDLYIIKQYKEEAFSLDKEMKYILGYLDGRPTFRPAAVPVAQEYLEVAKKNLSLFEPGTHTFNLLLNCANLPYTCSEARQNIESTFVKVFRTTAFPQVFEGIIGNYWNDERYNIPKFFDYIYPTTEQ